MIENEFLQKSEEVLIKLADLIENSDQKSIFDVEYLDGILTITTNSGQYVINKHLASRKIWFSSPITGANYFHYDQQKWLNDNNDELGKFLINELNNNFNITI